MASKRNCLLFRDAQPSQLIFLRNLEIPHIFISDADVRELHELNAIECIRPAAQHTRAVYRLRRQFALKGLSCKVGETLALAIQNREPWAQTMQELMRRNNRSTSFREDNSAIAAMYGAA